MQSPRLITLLDTSICNPNLGNQIITQSIVRQLEELFPSDFLMHLQYAERFGTLSLSYLRSSSFSFFGGTNSLSSEMNKYKQMGLGLRDAFSNLNIILFGLGWWQYQSPPNKYTRIFLRRLLLNSSVKHSVRDKYTLDMLATIGIHNALNTSCPTTWTLTPDHCSKVPTAKGKSVISTLTDYSKSPSADTEMISTLLKAYDKVYLWLQGLDDYRYLRDLGFSNHHNIIQIPPCLTAYERVLSFDDLDYIGTRLHAGIKAIQCGKRALIMSVDNRAHEISEDINLPVAPRGAIHAIDHFIQSSRPTEIRLPSLAITQWKNQFTT